MLGVAANEISTNEDVQNATDERYLLSQADGLGVVPLLAKLIDATSHLLAVAVELLVGRGNAPPPFFDHTFSGKLRLGLEDISGPANLVSLGGDTLLQLFELLR